MGQLVEGLKDVKKCEGGMKRVLTDEYLRELHPKSKIEIGGDEAIGDAADIEGYPPLPK